MKKKTIGVTLLTGFLGAGKTTLLNQILAQKADTRFAIIENEFGNIDIDSELVIRPVKETLFSTKDGCLCCSLNNNLVDILYELLQKRDETDELIIETTGIADPAAVAQTFWNYADIQDGFSVKRIVGIVDTSLILKQLAENLEAVQQIAFSDILILNKNGRVAKSELEKVSGTLMKINPFAEILREDEGDFPVIEILAHLRDERIKNPGADLKPHPFRHGEIDSFGISISQAIDDKDLQIKLFKFLLFEAHDLYRIKGILHSVNTPNRLILQSVCQSLSISGGKAWESDEIPKTMLVFIGKNLPKRQLQELVHSAVI